ncbi:hypothetical protein ACH5RR_023986 [Cinchona calisaya]|uniref:MULE transposase domain-containing protein n=1 Tax=Cinchona calisaya TaxID=153742 RepID=A0ABD2ZDA8_9GENT
MVDVSIPQVYRAKRKAKDVLNGVDMAQYNRIWSYAATARVRNLGSANKMTLNKPFEESICTFQRLYYYLFACNQGFLDGCRTIIGFDGCFLKSPFGGQLLTAMGKDGNNNMFPIAFAVVEVKCYESRKWFLEFLIGDIGTHNGSIPYTCISDRQKGLVHALNTPFLESEHRFCIRHLYQNFSQK